MLVSLLIVSVVRISAQKSFSPASVLSNPRPLVSGSSSTSLSDAEQQKQLEKYLTVETALLGVSDSISLYFKDLDHGKEFSIEPTKSWIPASTIKTYVVLEAFRQRDLGLINFNQTVTITADNVVPTELETDEFPRLREGTTATIKQLIEAMVTQSDNTAYNSLLDVLDRRNINLALKNIGLTETVVGEKLNLDDSQFQQDLAVPGRQPNTTTVKDLASFFDLLYNHKIADSDEILAIFKRQKINNMIPALLPAGTEVAHKTGDWAPIYHDGGVVFKPGDPFILTVFTNSGDPTIVSQLAKVAYFQNADSVGKSVSLGPNTQPTKEIASSGYPEIALSGPVSSNVLGETTDDKFPTITAEDLGINADDLSVSPKQADDLHSAFITPGSLIYNLKSLFQQRQLENMGSNDAKAKEYISLAKDKLSQVKTLLDKGDMSSVDSTLSESEDYLAKATTLAQTDPDKDLLLLQIKQLNDLHFAVLSQKAQSVKPADKEQFIDTVYNFYQKNQQQVAPVVNSSVIANAVQQKPAIGTITEVKNQVATIQFDDGTKKDVQLSDDTKVRSFNEQNYQSSDSIKQGDKIAVVGLTNADQKIVPEFILKDVPKELPSNHTGTIVEINPDASTLKMVDKKGNEEIIKVEDNTTIKAKDTDVSVEGIKAGSQITVFGTTETIPSTDSGQKDNNQNPLFNIPVLNFLEKLSGANSSPSPIPSPTATPKTSASPSVSPTAKTPAGSAPSIVKTGSGATPNQSPTSVSSSSSPSKQTTEIKATSITVTVNSSGSKEVVAPKATVAVPVVVKTTAKSSAASSSVASTAKSSSSSAPSANSSSASSAKSSSSQAAVSSAASSSSSSSSSSTKH